MPITLKHTEQPLLNRSQSNVCRELVRGEQLVQALKSFLLMIEAIRDNEGTLPSITRTDYNIIELYLKDEIRRSLDIVKALPSVSAKAKGTSELQNVIVKTI